MASNRDSHHCRIPAVTIFIVCGLLCTAIAAASGVIMFFFMFGIVERSAIKEGTNQVDAVASPISSSYINIHLAREEIIGSFQRMVQASINGYSTMLDDIGSDAEKMTRFLNLTFAPWLLSMCRYDVFMGAEIAVMLPKGITEPANSTNMSRVSVYYEPTNDGSGKIFSLDITEGNETIIYQVSDINNTKSTHLSKILQKFTLEFISRSYRRDYAASDYFYFSAYVSTYGYPYYYATDYRYAMAGPYLFEVSVYQSVLVWFKVIESTLVEDTSTSLIVFDPLEKIVIASSFKENDRRVRNCYNDSIHFALEKDTCLLMKYYDLPSSLDKMKHLIDAAKEDSWTEEDVEVDTKNSKQEVDGEEYYIVTKQLGNINLLRPFLIWARTTKSVTSELRKNTTIVVVVSSLCILIAIILVGIVSAACLLAPLRHLQTKMDKLTRLETDDVVTEGSTNIYEDEELLLSESQLEHKRNRRKTLEMMDSTTRIPMDVNNMSPVNANDDNNNNNIINKNNNNNNYGNNSGKKRPNQNSMISEVGDLQRHFGNMARVLMSFAKYVPRDVVKELIASGDVAASGMQERYITLMFVDIAGFTTMCEKLDSADAVSHLLSLFFSAQTQRLQAHGATIDKFIGDCIMSFWGAPLAVENPNFRGLCAGLDLLRTARTINTEFQRYSTNLSIRVGLHCGRALVGNIGSNDRINYTALGDVVNSASRLEGINKQFYSNFLASEQVLLGSKKAHLFVTRFVGNVSLRGKSKVIPSFQVCGTAFHNTTEAKNARGNDGASHSLSRECMPLLTPGRQTENDNGNDQNGNATDHQVNKNGFSKIAEEYEESTISSIDRVSDIRAGMLPVRESYNVVANACYVGPGIAHICALFSDAVDGKQSSAASPILYGVAQRGIANVSPTASFSLLGNTAPQRDPTAAILGTPSCEMEPATVEEAKRRFSQLHSYITALLEVYNSNDNNGNSDVKHKAVEMTVDGDLEKTMTLQQQQALLEYGYQYDLSRMTKVENLVLNSIMKDLENRKE